MLVSVISLMVHLLAPSSVGNLCLLALGLGGVTAILEGVGLALLISKTSVEIH